MLAELVVGSGGGSSRMDSASGDAAKPPDVGSKPRADRPGMESRVNNMEAVRCTGTINWGAAGDPEMEMIRAMVLGLSEFLAECWPWLGLFSLSLPMSMLVLSVDILRRRSWVLSSG